MTDTLPKRANETDDETRLREAINRHSAKMLEALDAAIGLRSASPAAHKMRAVARARMKDFAIAAMHALSLQIAETENGESNG